TPTKAFRRESLGSSRYRPRRRSPRVARRPVGAETPAAIPCLEEPKPSGGRRTPADEGAGPLMSAPLLRPPSAAASSASAGDAGGGGPAPVASTATTCPYVSVERGWDGFLLGLKRHTRHEARRRLARLGEHAGARVRWVTEPGECAAGIRTLFDLHRRRFEHLGRPTAFRGADLEAFHVELAQAAARSGRLLLGILEEDGVP